MMKLVCRILLLVIIWIFVSIVYFFASHSSISAATFIFNGTPESISDNDSFTISVNLSIGSSAGKSYYIRPAFSYIDTPTSYFGSIKNNAGDWYNGSLSDNSRYFKVTMDENGEWNGNIEIKADKESLKYKGSGIYFFKLGRYTESGSSPIWCNESGCEITQISIVSSITPVSIFTPTPIFMPTNTTFPIKTPTPLPAQKPISTPTSLVLVKTPTSKPTFIFVKNEEVQDSTDEENIESPTSVLALTTEKASTPASSQKPKEIKSSQKEEKSVDWRIIFSQSLIGVGVIFILACAILAFRSFKKSKEAED